MEAQILPDKHSGVQLGEATARIASKDPSLIDDVISSSSAADSVNFVTKLAKLVMRPFAFEPTLAEQVVCSGTKLLRHLPETSPFSASLLTESLLKISRIEPGFLNEIIPAALDSLSATFAKAPQPAVYLAETLSTAGDPFGYHGVLCREFMLLSVQEDGRNGSLNRNVLVMFGTTPDETKIQSDPIFTGTLAELSARKEELTDTRFGRGEILKEASEAFRKRANLQPLSAIVAEKLAICKEEQALKDRYSVLKERKNAVTKGRVSRPK